MKSALKWFQARWKLCIFGSVSLAVSLIHVIREPRTEIVAASVMLVLAVCLLYDSLNLIRAVSPGRLPAWILLTAAILMSLCPGAGSPAFHHSLFLLYFTAVACRLFGLPAALRLLPACAVLLLIVPFRSSLMLYISYPLRQISTLLSSGILYLFDSRIAWEGTTIMLPGTHLAITDACSGIAQVEAMFLIAYLLVRRENSKLLWKFLHYLFLFPAIMLANVLRIILTAWLFQLFGDAVFSDAVHTGLGYFQVLLTIGIFFSAGYFLPEKREGGEA